MPWSMKRKLFILSLLFLASCSDSDLEIEKQVAKDPIDDLFTIVFEWEDTLSEKGDSLIKIINTEKNGITAYPPKNDIDSGKILFIAKEDSLLKPFSEKVINIIGKANSFENYHVWQKQKIEFSLYPLPSKEWAFMIRKR